MSDTGLNFGLMVSDESRLSRMGRLKTPVSGSNLLLGTAVEVDPANAGFLRQAAASAKPRTGTCGLLLQYEMWNLPIYGPAYVDSFTLGIAYPNRLSVIANGPGSKVWFKNTASQTRADGRVIPAATIFVTTSVAVGHGLAWNGTAWVNVTDPTDATSFMEVTYYDASRAYVEAILSH